jgi:hypothetical protein
MRCYLTLKSITGVMEESAVSIFRAEDEWEIEAGGCSETLVIAYHTTRFVISKDCHIKIVNILNAKKVEKFIHTCSDRMLH